MIKTDTQSTNVSFCFYSNLILTLLIQHSAYDREERYYIIRGKRMVQKNKERKKERTGETLNKVHVQHTVNSTTSLPTSIIIYTYQCP